MFENEIKNEFKNCKHFIGVFSRDTLPKFIKRPSGLIVNSDKSSEPGQHWLAIILLDKNKGEYFDSFGFPPLHKEIKEFINLNCLNGCEYNSLTLQHPKSSSCGKYCIAFLKNRFNGIKYHHFIASFSLNQTKNEKILKDGLKFNWIHDG